MGFEQGTAALSFEASGFRPVLLVNRNVVINRRESLWRGGETMASLSVWRGQSACLAFGGCQVRDQRDCSGVVVTTGVAVRCYDETLRVSPSAHEKTLGSRRTQSKGLSGNSGWLNGDLGAIWTARLWRKNREIHLRSVGSRLRSEVVTPPALLGQSRCRLPGSWFSTGIIRSLGVRLCFIAPRP